MMKQNYQREDCSQMIDIFLNILGVCQTNKYLTKVFPSPSHSTPQNWSISSVPVFLIRWT